MITVKYFAYLRERIGRDEDAVEAEGIATVGELRRVLADDGGEVAFFPPVTGG